MDLDEAIKILKPIKDAQIFLEASDKPRFHVAARTVLKLLYTDPVLMQHGETLQGRFCDGFKGKMVHFFDNISLILEYRISAFVDPR